jgi:hypothetical protein
LIGALLFYEINPPKCCIFFGLDCRMLEFFKYSTQEPSSKELSCIFGARFGGTDCSWCPFNPSAKEVGGLYGFLYEAALNFEVFSNILDSNKKIKNLWRLMSYSIPQAQDNSKRIITYCRVFMIDTGRNVRIG